MPRFCTSCGAPLEEDALFCTSCGARAAEAPTPVPPPEQPIPQQPYQQAAPAQPYQQPAPAQPYQQAAPAQPYQQPTPAQPYQQAAPAQPYQQAAPAQPYQQAAQAWTSKSTQKKKSRAGLIAAIAAVVLAGLAAVACFVWPGWLRSDGAEPAPTTAPVTAASTEAPTAEPTTAELTTAEPATTEAVDPFLDVAEDAPEYPAYLWCYENGVIEAGYVNEDAALTKGETISLIWRAMGSPRAALTDLPFTDVTAADDCYPALLWASQTGVASGDGEFNPGDEIIRAQAFTFLCRAAGGDGTSLPRAFVDTKEGKYYYAASNWGCAAGIVRRGADCLFRPDDPVERGQLLCWLARTMDASQRLDNTVPYEGDSFADYGIEPDLRLGQDATFLCQTKNDPSAEHLLSVKIEDYRRFASAEGYEAKEGQEWCVVTFLIEYGEESAKDSSYGLYLSILDSNHMTLFRDTHAPADENYSSAYVLADGNPAEVLISKITSERVDGGLFRTTEAVRVPAGYDGLAFSLSGEAAGPDSTQLLPDVYGDGSHFAIFRFD